MADCKAVKLWRDAYRMNLSVSWKADVDKTVTDLELWKKVIEKWKREKRHPGIKGILDEYESRKFDEIQSQRNRVHSEQSISERTQRRMSEPGMPSLWAGKRL